MFDPQFGFRQKHCTSRTLNHLADKIREQLEKKNFGCGIFVDSQKAFDAVSHDILFKN